MFRYFSLSMVKVNSVSRGRRLPAKLSVSSLCKPSSAMAEKSAPDTPASEEKSSLAEHLLPKDLDAVVDILGKAKFLFFGFL